MATAIQRFTWNSLALDADDDSADDLLMTPLSPVFDANLYPGTRTCHSPIFLAVIPSPFR